MLREKIKPGRRTFAMRLGPYAAAGGGGHSLLPAGGCLWFAERAQFGAAALRQGRNGHQHGQVSEARTRRYSGARQHTAGLPGPA